MKIRPIGENVVVERLEEDTVRASGLIIPDVAQEKSQLGVVVGVGPGSVTDTGERVPMEVAVGDTVVFSKFGNNEIKVRDESFILLRESDIFGIVEE